MPSVYEIINENPLTTAHAYFARQIDLAEDTSVVDVLNYTSNPLFEYTLTVPTNDAWIALAQSAGYSGSDAFEAIDFMMSVTNGPGTTSERPEYFSLF